MLWVGHHEHQNKYQPLELQICNNTLSSKSALNLSSSKISGPSPFFFLDAFLVSFLSASICSISASFSMTLAASLRLTFGNFFGICRNNILREFNQVKLETAPLHPIPTLINMPGFKQVNSFSLVNNLVIDHSEVHMFVWERERENPHSNINCKWTKRKFYKQNYPFHSSSHL